MSSRNQGYDSESRRSPRSRSPPRYNEFRDDYRDRGGAGRGGERRRSISDTRPSNNFSSGRDGRDFSSREPPRGPKVPIDAPSGPRASYSGGDFRGDFGYRGDFNRGRGRARGRGGWRDDSRDRGRESEREYRGSRDDRGPPPPFRDDRSRDRDRWERDNFRGRRQSSPQGRGRSPIYGTRESRDGPSSLDVDRARRGSRDGPLSGGSPSSDSLQPFRGYGRGRGGRGRGRGGYYDDYHGRNPSPDPNWSRRTQPSATPPPQVPAFGSTSTNLPVPPTAPKITVVSAAGSPGPLSGVSIPTAPRSQRSDAKLSRPHGIATSAQWVNPDIAKKGLSKPKEIAKSPSKTPSPTEISAPAPQLASNASPEAHTNQSTELASKESAPLLGSSLVTTEHKSEIPKSKRRPILIRHPPRPTAKDSPLDIDDGSDDSDADSVDSIGRGDFFEEDIEKLEDKISKLPKNLEETEPLHLPQLAKLMDLPLPASDDKKELQLWEQELEYRKKQRQKKYDQQLLAVNTLGPASEPDAHFLTPFINTLIDSQTLARHCALLQPTVSAECESAKVQKAATPPPIIKDSLAAPPQTKGRSRPTTPRIDTKTFTKPLINGKDDISGLGPQTSTPGPAPSIETADEPIFEMQGVPAAIGIEEVPNGQDHGNSATAQPIANGSRPEAKPMMEVPDESEDEQSAEERIEQLEAVRKVMKTPQLSSLPKFNVKRWDQDEEFLKTLEPDPVVEEHLKKKRAEIQARREREQREEQERWSERYYEYRKWTDFSNHPIAVRSRQKFAKAREAAAAEAASLKVSTPAPGSKPESSRRTGRWATEHDFERVLRESEQEANEAKEREERVARARTASAKEATIPAMCWDQEQWEETSYIDKTHLVPFERSFAILEFGEPIDNFTEEENEIFEKAYLEFPKQWGKIAEALPDRDYKACIQHYYLVKHGSGIKEKLKKQGRKRGRAKNPPKGAKPKSNALMADIVSRDDGEDGQDTENGERRRPRRAAAPTFAFEATPGDSEAASPAPTPGRKAAAPKGENSNDAPPKRKTKTPREKTSKQAKNSQLLAAAPTPTSPAVPALSVRRESASSNRFPPQYDGAAGMSTNFSPPTYTPVERPSPSINLSYEQPYNVPERLDSATPMSATPMSFDSQDRRSLQQQTSSYWSVPEQTEFPALLRYFGTDWNGIARHMTSKTHIMVYTTVFQQWLAVPTDTNKSRRVANIQAQVKNYYQRQIDSGKMTEWEVIARDADDKRRRGEDTGPIPNPIVIPKGRTSGPMPRAGPMLEGTDDMSPGGQNMMLQQASPTQPSLSSRFPAIAQAGPVPQTLSQPGTPTTSLLSKHLPPQQPTQHAPPQLQQQARSRGGPALGYFNPDPQRSMLQASVQPQSTPPLQESVSQRSVMVAKEAHLERLQALKLEREQAALQQQQSLQQQQQHAIQKERQLQMKQENDLPNLQQYEPYSNPSPHPNVLANSRNDNLNPMALPEARRTAPPPLQYQNRNPQVRSLLTENLSGGREIKSSPSPAVPRAPMSAPPAGQEPYNAPPAPPPSQPPPARQPEPKRSNISSLLNDEPAEPAQPTPPTRINNLASATLQTSHTPPPQHISQPPRYAPHPSQSTSQSMSHQLAPHLSQQHQPSQIAYAPSPVHSSHQPSSVGPSRTYTPNNFDSRAYGAPPSMQQQQQQHQQPSMYSQPPRQSMVPQPPPIRRESSLGEGHSLAGGYARSSAPSQTSMRLKESPYSATPAPAPPQAARQQIGSPHDLALPDREYYSQQYRMQQPSTTAGSPPLGPSYHALQQQTSAHRQLAFGGHSHTASPPTQYASQHPQALHRSRHNSIDAGHRYPIAATSAPASSHQGYAQAPQHQGSSLSMQYQQQTPLQDRLDYERERERREQYQRHVEDPQLLLSMEEQQRRHFENARRMDNSRR